MARECQLNKLILGQTSLFMILNFVGAVNVFQVDPLKWQNAQSIVEGREQVVGFQNYLNLQGKARQWRKS